MIKVKEYIYLKNHNLVAPIASITKLMTAIVTLEAGLPFLETLKITRMILIDIRIHLQKLGLGQS